MNRDETIALFERCEAARAEAKKAALAEGKSFTEVENIAHEAAKAIWNGEWAEPLLAERKAMENDGRWENEKARWKENAKIDFSQIYFHTTGSSRIRQSNPAAHKELDHPERDTSDDKHDETYIKVIRLSDNVVKFSGFKFPGTVWFYDTKFSGGARFDNAIFCGSALFEKTIFSNASFANARFSDFVSFQESRFSGGFVRFAGAAFSSNVWFIGTLFSGNARFESAGFFGNACFDNAQFFGEARFEVVAFSGSAQFVSASFSERAFFNGASFLGSASFRKATFADITEFDDAIFSARGSFRRTLFSGSARFREVTFREEGAFGNATFSDNVLFRGTVFQRAAYFSLAKFGDYTNFENAQFLGPANFNAVRGDRAFTLEDAHFEYVPDFIQAHFEEAPRLDNVRVVARMIPPFPALEKKKNEEGEDIEPARWDKARHWAKRKASFPRRFVNGSWQRVRRGWSQSDELRDMPAQWRALKRLAIQAHDQDREHRFFAREIRSARFLYDWPLPNRPFGLRGWLGFARFWAGCAYGVFSNYGRSVLLPAFWWGLALLLAAMFYFTEHRDALQRQANARPQAGPERQLPEMDFLSSWWNDKRSPCYTTTAQIAEERFSSNTDGKRSTADAGHRPVGKAPGADGWRQRSSPTRPARWLSHPLWRRRYGAPHLWLPLWRGAVWRGHAGCHRTAAGRILVGDAQALVGGDDLPVRPRPAQHAEDEVSARRRR